LIFGGLWNIVTGLTFRMPMCVQPMKCMPLEATLNRYGPTVFVRNRETLQDL
jgi:hypothetical protein